MIKPITPREALKSTATQIPEIVFEVSAVLTAKGITDAAERGWLDVEPHYQKAGWSVEYDNPGYNESYEGHWIFKPKGRR